jgi:hypothetical protein
VEADYRGPKFLEELTPHVVEWCARGGSRECFLIEARFDVVGGKSFIPFNVLPRTPDNPTAAIEEKMLPARPFISIKACQECSIS